LLFGDAAIDTYRATLEVRNYEIPGVTAAVASEALRGRVALNQIGLRYHILGALNTV
jgi:hypothetical protein